MNLSNVTSSSFILCNKIFFLFNSKFGPEWFKKNVHQFHLLVGYFVKKIDLKWGAGLQQCFTEKENQPKSVTFFFEWALYRKKVFFQRAQGTRLRRSNCVITTWIPEQDGATSNLLPKDWREQIRICRLTNNITLNDNQLCILQYTKGGKNYYY